MTSLLSTGTDPCSDPHPDQEFVGEILPPRSGMVHVFAVPHPFSMARVTIDVQAGVSLADILDQIQPIPVLRMFAHVAIGDHVIEHENLHRIRPRPGTRVTIRMLPGKKAAKGGGGSGKGKNPLATILSIVTVIAAIAIPPLAIAALGLTAGGTAALITGGLMAGGIMIAGGMLSNALAPPSKPKLAALAAPAGGSPASQDAESPTLSISGARNDLRPYSPVAVVLGKHWQVPALGAPTYTEVLGSDQYLRMVVIWGVGPLHITDRKIGETALASFQDVQYEFKRGYQPWQIRHRGGWAATAFPTDPVFGDRWDIIAAGTVAGTVFNVGDTITFNGLAPRSELRAWDINEDKQLSLYPSDIIEQHEQIILSMDWQTRTTELDTDQISFDLTYYRGLTDFAADGTRALTTATMLAAYAPTGTGAWVDIQPIINQAATTEVFRQGWTVSVPRGQYDVRWKRFTTPSTTTTTINDCAVTALRSIRLAAPFDHRGIAGSNIGLCCEAFRIRATDQLQGMVDTLSGICWSIVPEWNGSAWVHSVSSNPAALFRWAYQGPGNPIPIADSEIDLTQIVHWHEFCSVKGFSFNHVVDYSSRVDQIATDIAAAGRASVSSPNNKITIVIDEPAIVPVQIFTPRNSWGFRSEITYPDLPHAYRVRFIDNLTGKGREIFVYDDGYSAANSSLFEVLQLTGVTDPAHAYKQGRYHLAVARLRRESVSFYADFEALVCTRGDLIRLNHDVALWGLKSGTVVEAITEDQWTVGVVIDEEVTMEPGKNYTVRFRRPDRGLLEISAIVTLRIGVQTTLTFSGIPPVIGAAAVRSGDLWWFGETGAEHRDLRVHAIVDPSPEHSVRLICVEDNPAIYMAELAPIPPYDPGISSGLSILYPRIISVRSDGTVVFRSPNGTYDNRILIAYSPPSGTMATSIQGVEAQYKRLADPWFQLSQIAQLVTGDISLTNVDGLETYLFQLRFVRRDGTRGIWGPMQTHTVIAGDGVPPDVPYFVVTRLPDGTRRFEWRMVLEPSEVLAGGGYRVKRQSGTGFNWATATDLLTNGLIRSSPHETNDVSAGTWTFGIKAVTASGIESTAPRTLTIELGDPRMRDVLMQTHEHISDWPGSLTDCFKWGTSPRHLHAAAAAGGLWDAQGAWNTLETWDDLPVVTPMAYTTLVITVADGINITFTPRVDVDADGDVAVDMRVGTASYGSDLSAKPWTPLAQVLQSAYLQIRVTADGPRIRQVIVTLDGAIGVDDIEDIDTLNENATWFQRVGVGHFRVATRKPFAAITGASIRAIQTDGTNWTWRLASKSATVAGNSSPAAEFRIYNATIATDALVDVELKGPLL